MAALATGTIEVAAITVVISAIASAGVISYSKAKGEAMASAESRLEKRGAIFHPVELRDNGISVNYDISWNYFIARDKASSGTNIYTKNQYDALDLSMLVGKANLEGLEAAVNYKLKVQSGENAHHYHPLKKGSVHGVHIFYGTQALWDSDEKIFPWQ